MKGDWSGSDAVKRWAVKPGDIWIAGSNILACGDVEKGSAQELVDRFGPVNLIYTDPPWNLGIATSFRKVAGFPKDVDFWQLLRGMLQVSKTCTGDVFVEMGKQNVNALEKLAIGDFAANVVYRWEIKYIKGWGST